MIEVDRVSKVYRTEAGEVFAVRDASLRVGAGEFLAVTGRSGSGKSTLLNLMAGLDTPTSGAIRLEGQDLARMPDGRLTRLRRDRIGVIFQFYNLLPTLTVRENVLLPARLAGRVPPDVRERAEALLDAVELRARADHRPHELSGGEMQRAAVARALIHRPAVVLADEPTGNLDSRAAAAVLDLLVRLCRQEQAAVVMVTHSLEAATLADRHVSMKDGELLVGAAA